MTILIDPRFKMAMRVAFWLAAAFALTMAFLPQPPTMGIERMSDKFAHMLAFGTLAGLGALGFAWASRWHLAERLSFLGALVEVVQAIPALQRDCDIRDWIADSIAIIVVIALASFILPRLCPQIDDNA